ncbi:MAG: hypothetical protein O9327_10985 [Polaromonas sp.]|nr:hypothetical protein [Polaromonas sp.]
MATMDVPALQARLADLEAQYEPIRKPENRNYPLWDAISAAAAQCRQRLFALTGDSYGRPKTKPTRPSDQELGAEYATPCAIPAPLMSWARRNLGIITSDGTDLVRWSRIVDTLDDERLDEGEVTIYRAVDGDDIREGDWVTTDRAYAQMHLSRHLRGRGQVVEMRVDGRDVLMSPTGNYEELIYAPREFSGPHLDRSAQSLKEDKKTRSPRPR